MVSILKVSVCNVYESDRNESGETSNLQEKHFRNFKMLAKNVKIITPVEDIHIKRGRERLNSRYK